MTTHSAPGHGPAQHRHDHAAPHRHDHSHGDAPGLALMLDLTSDIFASQLDEIVKRVADNLSPDNLSADDHGNGPEAVASVVDLGAGTGSGTLALARRFPRAAITAVDRSPEMLARIDEAAGSAGLADRVTCERGELDPDPDQKHASSGTWDTPDGIDLAWASSSLHECADPNGVLRRVAAALRPGGTAAVVEFVGLPRFLDGEPGQVELRCHDAVLQMGWNHYTDWKGQIESAGLTMVRTDTFTSSPSDAPPDTVERCARMHLARIRSALSCDNAPGLSRDAASLDELLAHPSLPAEHLRPSLTRRLWIARKPGELDESDKHDD